ncbi:hypothetical protein [Desulfobacter sp.]|uniref:hypothetical protein n=1 Tax=Desulfobacter sp. TaxID=2294 RepID=UPI003D099B8B
MCLVIEEILFHYRIDDAVSAVPVHLGCGIWGTLAVALFGDPQILGTGLSFLAQLLVQVTGILAACLVGFPIMIKNSIEGEFFIYQDITERKALEDQLYASAL